MRERLSDISLNVEAYGPENGDGLVLLHGLGLSTHIWDDVVPLLPSTCRILALDMRGHGASDVPPGPYTMGGLIHDVERVLDLYELSGAVVVGHSVGGMIAQGLAVKRLDLVRALVLSNTAARIGTTAQWHARAAQVASGGMAAYADETMLRWFGRGWQSAPAMRELRRQMIQTAPEGWIAVAQAIAGTDFYTPTASLTLPTLAIAGANDGATPPDLVRETADLIRGSRFALIKGAGHVPMSERPAEFAALLTEFLRSLGYLSATEKAPTKAPSPAK